jgi:hypothetical protein
MLYTAESAQFYSAFLPTTIFFPLYFFLDFIHILKYSIPPGCHPVLGPTSLSGNSCSWAARGGGGDWVRIEIRTGNQQSRRTPTTISFLPKTGSLLRFIAENAQNDLKTHSYKYSAKFNVVFSATKLSHASRFRRKRGVIENFKYLCEF